MTEDEAKTKVCFAMMARTVSKGWAIETGKGSDVAGEDEDEYFYGHCIASACMAWRWREVMETQDQMVPMPQDNPDGFCGLAGRP